MVIPTGGNVYLYTYPAAIGYTYFFPLQDHYNDMEDHRIVARQIERCKPKAILIHKVSYQDFLALGRSSVAPPEVALPEGGGNAGSHYPGKKGERRRPRGLTGRRACRAGAARPFGWDPQ